MSVIPTIMPWTTMPLAHPAPVNLNAKAIHKAGLFQCQALAGSFVDSKAKRFVLYSTSTERPLVREGRR